MANHYALEISFISKNKRFTGLYQAYFERRKVKIISLTLILTLNNESNFRQHPKRCSAKFELEYPQSNKKNSSQNRRDDQLQIVRFHWDFAKKDVFCKLTYLGTRKTLSLHQFSIQPLGKFCIFCLSDIGQDYFLGIKFFHFKELHYEVIRK